MKPVLLLLVAVALGAVGYVGWRSIRSANGPAAARAESTSRDAASGGAGGSLPTAAGSARAANAPAPPVAQTAPPAPTAERRPWDVQYLNTFYHQSTNSPVRFDLTGGAAAAGTVRYIERRDGEVVYVTGTLTEPEAGRFFFQKQAEAGKQGAFAGVVELFASQTAWRIEPTGPGGASELVKRALGEVTCLALPPRDPAGGAEAEEIPPLDPSDHPDYQIPAYQDGIIPLQSRPGSTGVLYIDYRGGYTPTWGGITYARPNVSNAQIKDVWKRVAEDYLPFNINVTTDIKVYEAAPATSRQRVVVTPTTTAAPGAGGVAYMNSWNWSGDTPCWSFYSTGKSAAEVISHEAGHTLTLGHDGRTSPDEGYYGGQGTDPVGWAPIMGVGYYKAVTQWSRGEYANANNSQDDLAMIVSENNSVDYRADDTGATLAASRYLDMYPSGAASAEGVIETTGDTDAFQFTTTGGAVSLRADPAPGAWANLAISATLADETGAIVASHNPQGQLWTSINTTVAAGSYTFRVTGVGRNDPVTDGFSDYASLGYYSITGSVANARQPSRFSIAENSANGTVIGTITATNLGTDALAYAITSGNTSGAFAVASNGVLTVANSAALNYEALAQNTQFTVQYQLFVNITNLSNPALTELNRRVVVQVLDVNEAPAVTGFTNLMLAGTAPGTALGTVTGADPDYYAIINYSILSGNTNNLFALGAQSGVVTVNGELTSALAGIYNLSVRASDGVNNATTTVRITVVPNHTPFQPGSVRYAVYDGIGTGNLVSDLTGNARFPRDPDWEQARTLFEGDTDRANEYGSVMRAYLIPPVSGAYTFWIATDDNGELRLSNTTNPATAVVIASISGSGSYASPRQWTKFASQQSPAMSLTAGQGYYIEARHREGGGGDNFAVAWKGPATQNLTNVIPGAYLAPYSLNYVPRAAGFTANVRRDLFPGARVGRVTVTDANAGDTHTFVILSGNTGNIFALDAAGYVTVANAAALAATGISQFTLSIRVTDSGSPALSATCTAVLKVTAADGIVATQLQRELFYNLGSDSTVAALTNSAKFPGKPDALAAMSSFASATGVADNYGSRVRAYVVPPVSGDYTFFIASDDDSQLLLSTGTNPANAKVIASISGWSDPNVWTKFASQTSPLQTGLVAGQRYYIEALQKEGGGGDHVSVGWSVPGSGVTNVIAGAYLQPVDLNQAPQMPNQMLMVVNNASNGTVVGTLNASDSPLDYLSFRLLGGNTGNTFALEPATGNLVVASNALLAAGSPANYSLAVAVQDSGYDGLYPLRSATATVSVVVVPAGGYAEAVIRASPLGYWRLGELSGTTAFDCIGGNNGTYANATLGQAGAIVSDPDKCARFGGSSTYVGTGRSLVNDLAAFTMEGWFRLAIAPAKMGFWGQNDAIEFGLQNSTTMQVWTSGGGSLNVTYSLGYGAWHHVAVVGNGTDLRIYLDGNLAGTGGSATSSYGSSSYAFNIGGGGIWDATGNWFTGWIDEVALYDKALSAADIKRHYLLGLPLPLVALSSPANGATFVPPATINLVAGVAPNGHTITNVQFFNGTNLLSTDTVAPYSYSWGNVGPGTASLRAVALYDSGSVTSAVANITIWDPAPPVIAPAVGVSGENFTFQFTGTVGQHYRVEFAPMLPSADAWQVLTDVVSLASSPFTVSDPATNVQRYYRVVALP